MNYNRSTVLASVRNILNQESQLDPERAIVVGVSGGPDSLCLVHVLQALGYAVIVAHLNHGLRTQAEADAKMVERMAARLGLPFHLGEEDVFAYAEVRAMSVEEAARELRYNFLFGVAREQQAQAVAVGHNADDQVETVLMHLLRGAGLSGLKGMQVRSIIPAWSEEIPLLRPLLALWREQIMAYCRQHDLEPVFDESNLDTTFYRNRLRHELIPTLEGYNPQARQAIWRTAATLAGDFQVLQKDIDDAWMDCVLEQGNGWVGLTRSAFGALPLGLQRGLMRRAIATIRPALRDIDFGAVERALQIVSHPPLTNQADLIAGLRLVIEADRCWLATWEADLPSADWPQVAETSQRLDLPGEVSLRAGWRLCAKPVASVDRVRQLALTNKDPYQAWLDLGEKTSTLVVRGRRPGDRFQPLGMLGQGMKLADFYINLKLPRRARDGWPLLCAGEHIVWVPGLRLAHPFRLRPETEKVVHVCLQGAKD